MLPFPLARIFLLALTLPLIARSADAPGKPVATPPVPVPAFLDVTTFRVHVDGEEHKLIVTSGPNLLRIDEPADRYSILYNPTTDHYTGLEHSNYTYWQFAWADVHDAIEKSKRYENRLQQLNSENAASYHDAPNPSAETNAADASAVAPTISGDTSAYTWKMAGDRKRISGLDCVHWIGTILGGDNVDAWCVMGPLPAVQAALDQVRKINEPIALVPVRTLIPPFVYTVYDSLAKGGATPVQITWGDEQDKNQFIFLESRKREGKMSLFTVPNTYMKTTLVTMDGILDSQTEKKR
jgi:hypothetical protein